MFCLVGFFESKKKLLKNMAKRRSKSAKVKEDNTKKPSSAFSGVNSKANAVSAKNGLTTGRAQLRKRGFKSTDGCSKRASVKQGDCKDLGNEEGRNDLASNNCQVPQMCATIFWNYILVC